MKLSIRLHPVTFRSFSGFSGEQRHGEQVIARVQGRETEREAKRALTLIGNEPIAACLQRIREVIAGGGEPVPQRLRPLDWLGGPLTTLHDWDEPTLIAAQRFYMCPQLWKRIEPREFFYQQRYPLRGAV